MLRKALVVFANHLRLGSETVSQLVTKLGSSTWGRNRQSRERDPTNLLPLHFLLKADNYLNMPASFLPSRAFTSVIQQQVCEWKTSTALGTWGQQSWLPDTPAACWHSSGINQVSGCRGSRVREGVERGQNGECNHRNQRWTNQGTSRLMVHLAKWRCGERLTTATAAAASWIKKKASASMCSQGGPRSCSVTMRQLEPSGRQEDRGPSHHPTGVCCCGVCL